MQLGEDRKLSGTQIGEEQHFPTTEFFKQQITSTHYENMKISSLVPD